MSRYRLDEACITVTPYGSRLLVRWTSADYFGDILASFRSALPRHGEVSWNGEQGAWSVSAHGRGSLERWLAWTFEPGCIQWEEEPAGYGTRGTYSKRAYGHGRYRDAQPATTTLEAAYSTLCLTPQAPDGLVDTVYRWWSKTMHPDLGGDGSVMARVNDAVGVIRQHRGRKAS